MDSPAGLLRLDFQAHQQIYDFAPFDTTVEDIARLDQVAPPADPGVVLVNQVRRTEDSCAGIEIAVDVPNGHNPLDAIKGVLLTEGRKTNDHQYRNQEGSRGHTAHFQRVPHPSSPAMCEAISFPLSSPETPFPSLSTSGIYRPEARLPLRTPCCGSPT